MKIFAFALAISLFACGPGRELGSVEQVSANDPHLPRGDGPWFEGWYTRITDADRDRSIAVVVGQYKPAGLNPGPALPGYLAVLVSDGTGAAVRTFEVFPERVQVTRDGAPVEADPDLCSPASFTCSAEGYGTVTPAAIDVRLPAGGADLHLSAAIDPPLFWHAGDPCSGPEGAGALLPLPLHWHVSNLGSRATYSLQLPDGTSLTGRGFAHQEKNWGSAFPVGWSWGQGIAVQAGQNQAQVAFAGGTVALGTLAARLWIAAFRSGEVRWDFLPVPGTVFDAHFEACDGAFELRARDPLHTLEIRAKADPGTFGPIAVPTEAGFEPGTGQESFSATVVVRAYRHDPIGGLFGREHLVDEVVFRNAALEFGASFACKRQ